MKIRRTLGANHKVAQRLVRLALTALLAFRLVLLPAIASANPVPQVDPNLLPVCTVYGLYYVDLRTGEKVAAEDQENQKFPKIDDCTFCHFVCHAAAIAPKDTTSDIAPLVLDDRRRFWDAQFVWLKPYNKGVRSRAPPAV